MLSLVLPADGLPAVALLAATVLAAAATPAAGAAVQGSTMRAAVVSGSAHEGDWSKVKVVSDHPVPQPGRGQALIRVAASSVNPVDWKLLSSPLYDVATAFGTHPKVAGFDIAGTVESVGEGCARLKPGDEVWADLGKTKVLGGFVQLGAWAEFAIADESQVGLKPASLGFREAASLPLVGLTDLQALRKAGAPWAADSNVTAVVTSGSGGTGTAAIQMARWFGAKRIVTAASPANAELLGSLGATEVIDYHKSTIWESLAENSVDVVYDNFGAPGTADKAMASLRPGGIFIFLPGKGGALSKHPKPGVKQIDYGLADSSHHEDLDALASIVEAGGLKGVVQQHFDLVEIKQALNASMMGHIVGKVGIDIAAVPTQGSLVV